MNEKQILEERKTVRKTIIKDEAVKVTIRVPFEGSSEKISRNQDVMEIAKPEVETHSQTQSSDINENIEEPTDQKSTLELIKPPKILEISIVEPIFHKIEEIKANTTSEIKIPEYRDRLKHIHLVDFQLLKPTSIEIGSVAVKIKIPETSVAKALKSVLERIFEPEFEKPKEVTFSSEIDITTPKIERTAQTLLNFITIPNIVTSVKPSEIEIKSLMVECYARSTMAPSTTEDLGLEDFDDPIEDLFGSAGFKLLSERPIIILAEKPKDKSVEYIEFLKRILREIYRTRARGLPTPTHTSTTFDEIKLDIKAGKSIYVIDVDSVKIEDQNNREYLIDRIKELYSQSFGFIVLYGSESNLKAIKGLWMPDVRGFSRLPKYVEVKIKDRDSALIFANLFWGIIKPALDELVNLDEYIIKLEEEFYGNIEKIADDLKSVLIVEPSKEDKEGIEGESIVHYGIKAFIVKYLTETKEIPIENIQTEFELGDAIIDVFVRHPKHGDLAIEVETLYGTTLPLLKLRKRIESRLKKGLKTWIVIPNPQFMIYLKEISALRKFYQKKYHELIEFWTLDLKSNRLVSFRDISKLIRSA